LKGVIAASGMALAAAHEISQNGVAVEKSLVEDASAESERFKTALSVCGSKLAELSDGLNASVDPDTAEILDFQQLLLEDTDFVGKIEDAITCEKHNAEYAVKSVSGLYIEQLKNVADNSYLSERAADVADISERLIMILADADHGISEPDGEYIAISEDIPPSRLAELDKNKLKGIILEKGGLTSHCVILSRSLSIPCLIEAEGMLDAMKEGALVLLDAIKGEAITDPGEAQIEKYNEYVSKSSDEERALKEFIDRESITVDGATVKIFANITSADEVEESARYGGEGVGLFRSELLYMSEASLAPSEEKQYAEYAKAARALGGKPLIIRTLDVGGDKKIEYMNIGHEDNPFLGYRAIRYCLDSPEVFKPQISAILRAGAEGNVSMMFPMITCMEEIRAAKQVVEQVKNDLSSRELPYDADMKIGIMIETPAAALDAGILATEVDFFSIGTNDLSQYIFAADRANAKVASLNSPFQPALLRTVHMVVKAALEAGTEIDICGQAGEIDELIPLWVAMGVNNLSVSIPKITSVRRRICSLNKSECMLLLNAVLSLETAKESKQLLDEFIGTR